MKLYYPKQLYNAKSRWHIFPLLKSLMKEKNKSALGLAICDNLNVADVIILPMSWNYYYTHKKIDEVLNYYKSIPSHLKVISFVFGDIGVRVPSEFAGCVFRSSGNKSKLSINHFGLPIFVDDPIKNYFRNEGNIYKAVSEKAIVGFCGHARSFGLHSIKEILRTAYKNSLSLVGCSKKDTEQLLSTSYLRYKILNRIKNSDKVVSNFILRDLYRAGVNSEKESHPTTLQFYNNIKESDYIVCVRGTGNFSTRFYETLAMGRIPVFVNTDCLMPLESKIHWKQHVVWVEYKDRHLIAEKISEFHNNHCEESLNNLFLANRKLWKEYLQLYFFFKKVFNIN